MKEDSKPFSRFLLLDSLVVGFREPPTVLESAAPTSAAVQAIAT